MTRPRRSIKQLRGAPGRVSASACDDLAQSRRHQNLSTCNRRRRRLRTSAVAAAAALGAGCADVIDFLPRDLPSCDDVLRPSVDGRVLAAGDSRDLRHATGATSSRRDDELKVTLNAKPYVHLTTVTCLTVTYCHQHRCEKRFHIFLKFTARSYVFNIVLFSETFLILQKSWKNYIHITKRQIKVTLSFVMQ